MIKTFVTRKAGRFWVALRLATSCLLLASPADAQVAIEADQGEWSEVGDWNFIPIHASVLDDGRVLTYGGTRSGGQGGFELDVWDPGLGLGSNATQRLPTIRAPTCSVRFRWTTRIRTAHCSSAARSTTVVVRPSPRRLTGQRSPSSRR